MPRKLGQDVNPRDDRGWRIPRSGTRSRKVYVLMRRDMPTKEIMRLLGMSKKTVYYHYRAIKHWKALNANRLGYKHGKISEREHEA